MKRAVCVIVLAILGLSILAACEEGDAWSDCGNCTSGDCDGEVYGGGACENSIMLGGAACLMLLLLGVFRNWGGFIRRRACGFLAQVPFVSRASWPGRMWTRAAM